MTSGLKWIQPYGFRDIKMHNVRVYHLQVKDGYILGKWNEVRSPENSMSPEKVWLEGMLEDDFPFEMVSFLGWTFHRVASLLRIPPSDSPDGWQEVRHLPNLPPEAWKTETVFIERVFYWGRQVVFLRWSIVVWYYDISIVYINGCVCLQWFLVVACMNMLIYTYCKNSRNLWQPRAHDSCQQFQS